MTRLKIVLGVLFALAVCAAAPDARAQSEAQAPPDPPQPSASSSERAEAIEEPEEEEIGDEPTLSFGVKGGVNVGWLENDDSTMDERVGAIAGLFAAFQPTGRLGVQIEALYSSKGYKTEKRAIVLDYVEVPVLATLRLPKLGPLRPIVLGGPYGGLRVRTRYGTAKSKTQSAFREDVNRWDFGLVAGLAIEVPLAGGALTIEGRYSAGLAQVFVEDSSYGTGSDRHRAYIGLVGFRF